MRSLKAVLIFIISFQLQAGVTSQMVVDYQRAMDGKIAPKVGDKFNWGGGVLTRNLDGTLTYVNSRDPSITQVMKVQGDMQTLAASSADVKKQWVDQYGVDVLANANDYSRNSQDLTKLLSKSGSPNTSVVIQGTGASLYYDDKGQAKSVVMPDGTVKTISEYLNSKEYSASVGIVDSTGSKSYVSTGMSNPIPENFSGEVKIATTKNADGSLKIFEGLTPSAGGEFDRTYNGISGTILEEDPLTESEYNLKFLDMTAQIWGVTEIGEKMCKPMGKEFPKSLVNWWVVLKNYVEAEKKRNALVQERIVGLKSGMSAVNSTGKSNIQLDGIKIQIESLNIGIDSLSGSSLYSGDKLASEVRATSRLAWREAVLAAIYQGIEDGKKEDSKFQEAYVTCTYGVETSREIASSAYDKATRDCARTKEVTDSEGKKSTVPDPVPGSCEQKEKSNIMKTVKLPGFKEKELKDLMTLYKVSPVPTKQMNERLLKILSAMNKQITVFFPKSNDSQFDWTTPLLTCIEPLTKPIKDNGVICPADASEKDYDKTQFADLGNSESGISKEIIDVYKSIGRDESQIDVEGAAYWQLKLDAGEEIGKVKTDAEYAVKVADDVLKAKGVKLTSQELLNIGDQASQDIYYNAMYPDETPEARKSRVENNTLGIPKYPVPDVKEISKNAQLFLTAMGITNSNSPETTKFLADKWNIIDLYFGQSNIRQFYFEYNADLVNDLVLSDRAKLGSLLAQRQKLIEYYNTIKKMLEEGKGTEAARGNNSLAGASSSNSTNYGTGSVNNMQQSEAKNLNAKIDPVALNANLGSPKLDSLASLRIASGGLLTYGGNSKAAYGSKIGGTRSGVQYSVAQNRKINKSKENIKKLQAGTNRSAGGSSSVTSDSKAAAKIKQLFDSKVGSNFMKGPGAVLLSSINGATGLSDPSKAGSTTSSSSYKNGGRASDYYSVYGSGSSGRSSGGSYGKSSGSNGETGSNTNSQYNGFPSASGSSSAVAIIDRSSSGMSPEDERKFSDAVFARDNNSRKDQFDRQSTDSIFQIIEKAHIRNYQKIQK